MVYVFGGYLVFSRQVLSGYQIYQRLTRYGQLSGQLVFKIYFFLSNRLFGYHGFQVFRYLGYQVSGYQLMVVSNVSRFQLGSGKLLFLVFLVSVIVFYFTLTSILVFGCFSLLVLVVVLVYQICSDILSCIRFGILFFQYVWYSIYCSQDYYYSVQFSIFYCFSQFSGHRPRPRPCTWIFLDTHSSRLLVRFFQTQTQTCTWISRYLDHSQHPGYQHGPGISRSRILLLFFPGHSSLVYQDLAVYYIQIYFFLWILLFSRLASRYQIFLWPIWGQSRQYCIHCEIVWCQTTRLGTIQIKTPNQ